MVDLKTSVYNEPYADLGVCPICNTVNGVDIPRIESIESALKRNY